MKEEKKESPIGVLWGWGKPYHGKFIGSIILAVLGVACQMVPYFCVAHIVTMMLSGEQNFSRYVTAGIIALCGYFGKVLFSCLSTTISHTATYYTLRDLRENITAKLARVPMGTILDTPSGALPFDGIILHTGGHDSKAHHQRNKGQERHAPVQKEQVHGDYKRHQHICGHFREQVCEGRFHAFNPVNNRRFVLAGRSI